MSSNVDMAAIMIHGEGEDGNMYQVSGDTVYLKPKDGSRARNIGQIKPYGDGLVAYMKTEKEKDRYRKTDAWSINWHVAKHVDFIFFVTKQDGYKISTKHARQHGEFLHFKSSTEKKLYVPVKFWTKKSEQ